jgi:hypothetical protein
MPTFLEKIEEEKQKLLRLLIIKDGDKELAECISEIRQSFDILIKESCQEFLDEILPEKKNTKCINLDIRNSADDGWNYCREQIKSNAEEIFKKL